MIEMKVKGIAFDQKSMMPVVILVDEFEERVLPIWIGFFEANAIALAIEGLEPPRPMTHDLMKDILQNLKAKMISIYIDDLRDSTYYARLNLETSAGVIDIDARPSDAIALALRIKAPIYVAEKVLMGATVSDKPIDEEEVQKHKESLKNIKPEDFTN